MERLAGYIAVILAISILTTLSAASAQTIPEPSIPEFTLKYVDSSYDVLPSYSTNPYTGENMTHAGSHIDNRTIQITIVNSDLASSLGKLYFIYYNVQIKGHNVENWTDLFDYVPYSPSSLLPQSDNEYTVILETVQFLPANVQLDFRVQSFLINQTLNFDIISTSDWSNTQTIVIPASSVSPSQSPTSTPSPSVPEFPNLVVIPLLLSTLGVALAFRIKKSKSKNMR